MKYQIPVTNNPPQNPSTTRPKVFVSYAHDDATFTKRLIEDLDAAGHACWIDTSDIKGGDEWMINIAEGISDSYAFVVIVTQKALESRWVRDEILWARNENKRIIPINITPLDPLRIREFAGRYLGAERGDELFWKLAGQAARDTHNRFIQEIAGKLDEPDRVFWLEPQLPKGTHWGRWSEDDNSRWENWLRQQGWRKDDNSRWEDWIRLREAPSSLMILARNPYMLLMLTSVYTERDELPENRGELFRLFVETLLRRERILEDEQAPLIAGLAKVAYEMQIRRADGAAGDALTALPKDAVNAILSERLLFLAGSASILSLGEQVRFTHQLLQEYFAARYMDIEIRAGRLRAGDIWPPDQWWERTSWEEAAILLSGL